MRRDGDDAELARHFEVQRAIDAADAPAADVLLARARVGSAPVASPWRRFAIAVAVPAAALAVWLSLPGASSAVTV